MTITGFIFVITCAVLGFWLVSFFSEAFGSKKAAGETNANDFAQGKSRRNDEDTKERTWFEVLDVTPSATVEEIKAAYRERARQYHPDRVEGLGPELRQIAERRMKELNVAYDRALRGR